MFTGIIQHVGRVVGVRRTPAGKRLQLDLGPLGERVAVGGSVAVDGACLTVSAVDRGRADFDAVPETLARTTLDALAAGDAVNLEPALAAGDALDGHLVQGHVDGLAEVVKIDRGPGGHVLHLATPDELTDQMVPKGSVALAGVSLTVVTVQRGRFAVALVPTTLAATTLGDAAAGGRVNLELDVLGKYVRRHLAGLSAGRGGLSLETLRGAGFA